jgi:beta-galactosidase
MEFHISGLGTASLNPYEFISAGLYSYGSDNLTNGNDRGIATARDGKSVIGFDRIDFGAYGSNEIVLPIFSLDSEEFPIEIWEGNPTNENNALLSTVIYQKPSIWNVYQEETYQLPKRLKGLTALYFVLSRKIHLKGFYFTETIKAYQKLNALEYTSLYGDNFTLTNTAIVDIGNNVSIVFDHMDFGENGLSELTLCGHSPLDQNTIQVRFHGEEGDIIQLIEFPYSNDYEEINYKLKPVFGAQTITFVFLPGCQFDFKWFWFQ